MTIKLKLISLLLLFFFVLLNIYYTYAFLYGTDFSKLDADPMPQLHQLIILSAIGFLFVCNGIYCYIVKPHSIITERYFYLMFAAGLTISSAIPSGIENVVGRPLEIVVALLTTLFLFHFFLHFPVTTKPNFFKHTYVFLRCLILFVASAYLLSIIIFRNIYNPLAELLRYFIIIFIIFALTLCFILIILLLKSNSSMVKNQLYILISSFFLSFFPVICFSLIPYIFFDSQNHIPFYYSIISVIIFPFSVTYMLTRQDIIDVRLKVIPIISKMGTGLLSLILTNALFFVWFQNHLNPFYRINLLIITGIVLFHIFSRLFTSWSNRRMINKAQEIKREKHLIMQQVFNGQHLKSCSRLIINLIHQTTEINGACLVWKQKQIPKIYFSTGIFTNDVLTHEILNRINYEQREQIQKRLSVVILPFSDQGTIKGWIFLGQKKNGARFDKNERTLIEGICSDALDLLKSSVVLSQMGSELEKTRNQSYSHEHFNRLLMNTLDENKRNLSIYLHDEVLQNVILLENRIDSLHSSHKMDDSAYHEVKESLMNTIYEIREKSRELHPFIVEDLGLEQSVQAIKKRLQTNYNVIVDTDYKLGMKIIPKTIELAAFRIIKELLYNSIKHASAPLVAVSLKCVDCYLIIIVSDHGKGFDLSSALNATSGHIGLLSVQKSVDLMNGLCEMNTSPGNGTTIHITLPLDWNDERDNQYHLN
ncbi:ATP-binding protein [Sporolactobacillus nakayamae]|uniref:histidine kinase n=1 Tax=Sporolactobacillus nakayamae TaxID=269670 RepID=A0A1I2PP99_9BACL|nr:ATP-binding protein [Sporolactobacillus nakayamae]SFG15261.1 two-component system, NarL family, sensor histidine kinase ComP [Sporolactobacillus nakayamae]